MELYHTFLSFIARADLRLDIYTGLPVWCVVDGTENFPVHPGPYGLELADVSGR